MDLLYVLAQNLSSVLASSLLGVFADPFPVAVVAATSFIATCLSSHIPSATFLCARSPESLWLPHVVPVGLVLPPLAHYYGSLLPIS